jgi:DNA-binding NtrC family response regulator
MKIEMKSAATPAGHEPAENPSTASGSQPATRAEFDLFLHHVARSEQTGGGARSLRTWLDLAEAWRITQALRDCNGNRSAAARMLGIGRRTLYAKMDKLGIAPTWSL